MSEKNSLRVIKAPDRQRPFRLFEFSSGGAAIDLMIYGREPNELRPLIILHSIEYPVPPSVDFCEQMAARGVQVIFIRRSGFGRSTAIPKLLFDNDLVTTGATSATEAALLVHLIERLSLENAVLLALSSSAPLGYRVTAMSSRVSQLILSNPRLNRTAWDNSRPGWFIDTLEQVMKNRSGVRLAEKGMKFLIKRDPISFFKQFLKNSPDDLAYLDRNEQDFVVAKDLLLEIPMELIFSETKINVSEDTFLADGCFEDLPVTVLAGAQSTDSWQQGLKHEAIRTGAAFEVAPDGDLFCAYLCPQFLAAKIEQLL